MGELDHQGMRDLCAGQALGILDPTESSRLAAHLRTGCAECSQEIEAYEETVADLGALLPEQAPPPGAEQRFLASLQPASRTKATRNRERSRRTASRWVLPAAAALAVASSLWVALQSHREAVGLRERLEAFETTTDPVVPIYDLVPTPAAGGGRARATFDPRSNTWRLFSHDLEAPPRGKTYQAWLVTDGAFRSLGTFLPDLSGHGFLTVKADVPEARVRVTLELEPGSDAPSGPLIFDWAAIQDR